MGAEGPYSIERRLAAGGMAEVFVAKRLGPHGFEKRVALKRILPQFAVEPDFVNMFIDEARLAARLEHSNIVQVFDFGQWDNTFYIAMELVDGSNVSHLLRAVAARDEAVPLEIALHIAVESAAGLAHAHSLRDEKGNLLDVVHRDVSPANMLLTRDGHMKLSDFGIARAASYEARTQTGQLRGKLGYMSPEQVLGRALDGRSDVFTLTTVLAEMLVAEPLFGKGNDIDVLMRIRDVDLGVLSRTKRQVPADVRALIEKGLSKHPEQRPDASAFLHMLHELAQRRGLAAGSARLTRLLSRLSLIAAQPGDEHSLEPDVRCSDPRELSPHPPVPAPPAPQPPVEATTYHARNERGQLGPLSYAELVESILSGRVDGDAMISRAGGPFQHAQQLDELERFFKSSALQWRAREFADPTWVGQLAQASLLPVVHRLTTQRETGVVHLKAAGRQKKLYFLEGRPDFIASTDRHEMLGEHLVTTGACLRMEVDMALAILPRYDGRLGDALVGLGVLRPMQLARAVQTQVKRRFVDAFTWRTGEWQYVRGVRSHEETFCVFQDSCELLRDAVGAAHPQELESALQSVRERLLVRSASPPMPLGAYRVPDSWQRVLERVNGNGTLSSVLARESSAGGAVEDVYRALYFGLSCEHIHAA